MFFFFFGGGGRGKFSSKIQVIVGVEMEGTI